MMKKHMNDIYPKELDLKHENSGNDKSASYLDLKLDVTNKELQNYYMTNVMIFLLKL